MTLHQPSTEPTARELFVDKLARTAEDLTAAAESLQNLSEVWEPGAGDKEFVRASVLYLQLLEVTSALLKRHAIEMQKSAGLISQEGVL